MKKTTLILLTLFSIFAIGLVAIVIIAFTQIKPTTERINQKLSRKFARIVRIPQGIPPPVRGFDETSYFWEMETLEGEVTGVRFRYTPAFSKSQKNIEAILEMPEGGDASIFGKVLPAVITDKKALKSALDIEKADLSPDNNIGYSKLNLDIKSQTKQTVRVKWEFEKDNLSEDLKTEYQNLSVIPPKILAVLYALPHFVLALLSG